MTPEGRLLRTCGAGSKPKLAAYLEDYAFLLDAMVALYEASWMGTCLSMALRLADVMVKQFWDNVDGGFFYTAKDHETLIARTKDLHDSSIPSGNGTAATALLRLAKLTGRDDLRDKAVRTLELCRGLMEASPLAAGQLLLALDFHLGPVEEIVIVGDPRGGHQEGVGRPAWQVSTQSRAGDELCQRGRRSGLGHERGKDDARAQGQRGAGGGDYLCVQGLCVSGAFGGGGGGSGGAVGPACRAGPGAFLN